MEITFAYGDRIITLPNSVVLALVCMALLLRYRRQVLSDRKSWQDTRKPVQPSLTASASAFDVMVDGTSGCLWSFAGTGVMAVVALIGLDLLLTGGAFTSDILAVLFSR